MNVDAFLRISAFLLHAGRYLYWVVMEHKGDREKPKTKPLNLKRLYDRIFSLSLGILLALQLLGLNIFPYQNSTFLQIVGFILTCIGIWISIQARIDLGNNWTHAAEYQIKEKHQLITHGIYKYIRHPIYSGMFLSFIGSELIVGSYLVIATIIVLPIVAYLQGKKEEKILIKEFGSEYKTYMKHSKMLLPYIW